MRNGDLFLYHGHTVYLYFKDSCMAFYYVNGTGTRSESNKVTDDIVESRVKEGAVFLCNIGDVLRKVFSNGI